MTEPVLFCTERVRLNGAIDQTIDVAVHRLGNHTLDGGDLRKTTRYNYESVTHLLSSHTRRILQSIAQVHAPQHFHIVMNLERLIEREHVLCPALRRPF